MNSPNIKLFLLASITIFITCNVYAETSCNGYYYLDCKGGVPGHGIWSGPINLKTMRWDYRHKGGGYVYGQVNDIICTKDKIAYQIYDETQGVTSNCFGKISSLTASGSCGINSFFYCKIR